MPVLTTLIVIRISSLSKKKDVIKNSPHWSLHSVYLSPLPLHRTALSDCSYMWLYLFWNHLFWKHCIHILSDQPNDDLREQAPWMVFRGSPVPRMFCKLLCVYIFLRRGSCLWFKYQWSDPLNNKDLWFRSLIWNSSKKISYLRTSSKFGKWLTKK